MRNSLWLSFNYYQLTVDTLVLNSRFEIIIRLLGIKLINRGLEAVVTHLITFKNS